MVKLINVFIFSLHIPLLMILYHRHKTLLNPFSFYITLWTFYTLVPVLLLFEYSISVYTSLYILVCNILFVLPSILLPKIHINYKSFTDIKFLERATFILIGVSILFILIHLYLNGYTLIDYIAEPLRTTGRLVSAKYNETLNRSIFSIFSTLVIYPNSFLSGYIYASNKNKLFLYFYLVPVLMYFIIFGNKGFLFLSLILYVSGFILANYETGTTVQISKKLVLKGSVGIALILTMVILAFVSRASSMEGDALKNYLIKGIRSYSIAHLYAFDDYFKYKIGEEHLMTYIEDENKMFYFTFKSMYNLAGHEGNIPHEGIYAETFDNDYVKSNIYTHFRGIIQDIGIMGSFVFFSFLGYIFNIILSTKYKYKPILATITWYIIFSYAYSSFIISNMIWISSIFGPALVLTLLLRERLRW